MLEAFWDGSSCAQQGLLHESLSITGRPLHGQEVSVATCPAAPRTLLFHFFKSSNAEIPTGILLCLVDCGVCLQGLSKMGYYSSKIIFW